MTELTKAKHFADNGETDRSGENFQNQIFANIDFKNRPEPISFFRSDFRAVKMDHMKFYYNNFDRADIVNGHIADSTFNGCKWGTDFINSVFTQSVFTGNLMDTCTIHKCYYKSCTFENERIINTSNRESSYSRCNFNNCSYEMNSFNDLNYSKCSFRSVNFANMGAYDLNFDKCNFKDVVMDPDYFGSYLFKDTAITDIKFAYRGKEFKLAGDMHEDLQSLALFYLENARYYEAFNTTLLFRHFAKVPVSIINYFETLFGLINGETNSIIKQEQIIRIVKTLIFYTNSDVLSPDELFYFIGYLKDIKIEFFSLTDKLMFFNHIDLLAKTVEAYLLDFPPSNIKEDFRQIYAEIQIDEENFDEFKIALDGFFREFMIESGLSEESGYQIVGTRKGSLIFELVGYAVGLYTLATILKSTVSKFFEIRVEYSIALKAQKLINEDVKTIEDLKKVAPVARKILATPSDEIFKKAKPLTNLMKQFHLFPNALVERRKIN